MSKLTNSFSTDYQLNAANFKQVANEVGHAVYGRDLSAELIEKFRENASLIAPQDFRAASLDVRTSLQVGFGNEFYRSHALTRWFGNLGERYKREELGKKLARNIDRHSGLNYILLHDGYGYNREKALMAINGPLVSAFEVIALVDLANNWVAQVREQAMSAIRRSFPATDPVLLAKAAPFLLKNMGFWKRWNAKSADDVTNVFYEERVQLAAIDLLRRGELRKPHHVLKLFARRSFIDGYLEGLWFNCPDNLVRECALGMLLNRKASWVVGSEFKWIDKALGHRKRVRKVKSRPLTVSPAREPLIVDAMKVKSTPISKTVAQALIDYRQSLDLPLREYANQLALHKAQSVRARAAYLLRKLDEEGR